MLQSSRVLGLNERQQTNSHCEIHFVKRTCFTSSIHSCTDLITLYDTIITLWRELYFYELFCSCNSVWEMTNIYHLHSNTTNKY